MEEEGECGRRSEEGGVRKEECGRRSEEGGVRKMEEEGE